MYVGSKICLMKFGIIYLFFLFESIERGKLLNKFKKYIFSTWRSLQKETCTCTFAPNYRKATLNDNTANGIQWDAGNLWWQFY